MTGIFEKVFAEALPELALVATDAVLFFAGIGMLAWGAWRFYRVGKVRGAGTLVASLVFLVAGSIAHFLYVSMAEAPLEVVEALASAFYSLCLFLFAYGFFKVSGVVGAKT